MSYFVAQDPDSEHAVGFEADSTEHALALLEESLYKTYNIVWSTEGTLRINRVKYDRTHLKFKKEE